MFHTVDEKRYLEVVDFTKEIYQKEVIKSSDIANHYYKNDFQPQRANTAFNRHKDHFYSDEEQYLFRLNLMINNNELFAGLLLEHCDRYLQEHDIIRIKRLFKLRQYCSRTEWAKIITDIVNAYRTNEAIATNKIGEILTFSNIYYPLEESKAQPIKSLSLR